MAEVWNWQLYAGHRSSWATGHTPPDCRLGGEGCRMEAPDYVDRGVMTVIQTPRSSSGHYIQQHPTTTPLPSFFFASLPSLCCSADCWPPSMLDISLNSIWLCAGDRSEAGGWWVEDQLVAVTGTAAQHQVLCLLLCCNDTVWCHHTCCHTVILW